MTMNKTFKRINQINSSNKVTRRLIKKNTRKIQKQRIVKELLFGLYDNGQRVSLDRKRKFDEVIQIPSKENTNRLSKLTKEERKELEKQLRNCRNNNMEFRRNGTEIVKKISMTTLQSGKKINDEIINFFFSMLQNQSDNSIGRNQNNLFLSTYFIPTLRDNQKNGYNFGKVKKWRIRQHVGDLFELGNVIIPCHINDDHWTCAIICIHQKNIYYLDSLGTGSTNGIPLLLIQYLKDEWNTRYRKAPFNKLDWCVVRPTEEEFPTQTNTYDCGVYVCMYAYYVSHHKRIDFHSSEIDIIRQRMAYSIMKKKICIHTINE